MRWRRNTFACPVIDPWTSCNCHRWTRQGCSRCSTWSCMEGGSQYLTALTSAVVWRSLRSQDCWHRGRERLNSGRSKQCGNYTNFKDRAPRFWVSGPEKILSWRELAVGDAKDTLWIGRLVIKRVKRNGVCSFRSPPEFKKGCQDSIRALSCSLNPLNQTKQEGIPLLVPHHSIYQASCRMSWKPRDDVSERKKASNDSFRTYVLVRSDRYEGLQIINIPYK